MSRAVKVCKYQTAGSFTLLVSSKLNGYKLTWFLQMSLQHTSQIICPSTVSLNSLNSVYLESTQDENGKVTSVMTWALHGTQSHWRRLCKIQDTKVPPVTTIFNFHCQVTSIDSSWEKRLSSKEIYESTYPYILTGEEESIDYWSHFYKFRLDRIINIINKTL